MYSDNNLPATQWLMYSVDFLPTLMIRTIKKIAFNNGFYNTIQNYINSGYALKIYKCIPNEQTRCNGGKEKLPETIWVTLRGSRL